MQFMFYVTIAFLVSRTNFFLIAFFVCVFSLKAQVPYFYEDIAKENQVPSELFFSIAMHESGRHLHGKLIPWPWTLNICGKGIYLNSKDDAIYFLTLAVESGCSVDVGLFQIHWQTHHKKFKSYSEALDPLTNMRAGAHILRVQHKKSNDWHIATGHYHSPNNKRLAKNYREKVFAIYNKEFQ